MSNPEQSVWNSFGGLGFGTYSDNLLRQSQQNAFQQQYPNQVRLADIQPGEFFSYYKDGGVIFKCVENESQQWDGGIGTVEVAQTGHFFFCESQRFFDTVGQEGNLMDNDESPDTLVFKFRSNGFSIVN